MHLIISYYTHYIIIVRMNYYQRIYLKDVQLTDPGCNSYQTFVLSKNIRQSCYVVQVKKAQSTISSMQFTPVQNIQT
jgi:hypothetical protein